MDLISYNTSWQSIQDSFLNHYSEAPTNSFVNQLKNFTFNQSHKPIFYVNFLYYGDAFSFVRTPKIIILNKTVKNIPEKIGWSTTQIVFKHNSDELAKLVIEGQNNDIFNSDYNYRVPLGMQDDYIAKFDSINNTWWNGLTVEEKKSYIQEGDEFGLFE